MGTALWTQATAAAKNIADAENAEDSESSKEGEGAEEPAAEKEGADEGDKLRKAALEKLEKAGEDSIFGQASFKRKCSIIFMFKKKSTQLSAYT